MTAIADADRSRIIIFNDADIPPGALSHQVIDAAELVMVDMNEHALQQDHVPASVRLEINNRRGVNGTVSPSPKFLGGTGVYFDGRKVSIWNKLEKSMKIQTDIGTEFDDRMDIRGSRQNPGKKRAQFDVISHLPALRCVYSSPNFPVQNSSCAVNLRSAI